VVLDFGLAKLLYEQRLVQAAGAAQSSTAATLSGAVVTQGGTALGTMAYMSPEQARGEGLDARTDLFSFGAVLYEMATGLPAVSGSTSAVLFDAILNRTPASPARLNPELPAGLERIIGKALEKERKLRYQTASDLRADLKRLKRDTTSGRGAAPEVSAGMGTRRRAALALLPAGLLLLAGGASVYWFTHRGTRIDSIAVLPFANADADPDTEYLSDGITESVINSLSALSELQALRVVPRSTVSRFRGRTDPQQAGRELKVRAVVSGTVAQRGDTLIVQAELVDVETESQLWGEHYSRKLADLLAVQTDIAKEISDRLRLRLSGEARERLARRYSENTEAYHLYLKGRRYLNRRMKEELQKAIESFTQAIDKDPRYALAYSGLADSYILADYYRIFPAREAGPRAKQAAMTALQLDPSLAEPHASLAHIRRSFDWDWAGAESEYQRAIALDPEYPTAHHWYAMYLAAMGRLKEAVAEAARARDLDPFSLAINTDLGVVFYYARRYDRALDQFLKTLDLDPNVAFVYTWLGRACLQQSIYSRALEEFQKAAALSKGSPDKLADLGYLHALSGKRAEALKIIQDLDQLSGKRYVSPYDIAVVYAGLGDQAQAVTWLEKAYADHCLQLVYLKVEPMFDGLRSNPRFGELLRRMKFPE